MAPRNDPARSTAIETQPATEKKKPSYGEVREHATIEQRVAEAEQILHAKRIELQDPAILSDPARLRSVSIQLGEAQNEVDALYARWAELEQKLGRAIR